MDDTRREILTLIQNNNNAHSNIAQQSRRKAPPAGMVR